MDQLNEEPGGQGRNVATSFTQVCNEIMAIWCWIGQETGLVSVVTYCYIREYVASG